ncbi:hypothetical protein P1X16_27745 [Hymenobacter sp. YC55]|nr:hypothetical protein [Hymenobacter sp. YC55]
MNYGFWIWKQKLTAVLTMLALAVDTSLGEEEIEAINYSLLGTNEGRPEWAEYIFDSTSRLQLQLALDEDDPEMVHLVVTGPVEIWERLKLIDAIQAAFSFMRL